MSLNPPVAWQIPAVALSTQRIVELTRTLEQRLTRWQTQFGDVRFSSSLAAEDMVITDALARVARGIHVFTLNTGRLHEETLAMIQIVKNRYDVTIESHEPDVDAVQAWTQIHGRDGFYDSEVARQACCHIRKTEPLRQALQGAKAWVTGMRRSQSVTRTQVEPKSWDEAHRLHKLNPLFDWQDDEVWAYLFHHQVPIHPLHRKGFPSIGCEPCTRAIRQGEDIRAGRWWWLNQHHKECGLHVK